MARSVLGEYSDGRHQCLSDFIVRRHRHQRYGRPFRRVINLRGSWQVATQPLNRLSGNSATATVFWIGATPPSSDHHDPAQEAVADALRNTWRVSLCAINRATRRVFIAMYRHKTAANARRFLGDLKRACPMRSRTILPVWQAVHWPPSVCAGALPHDRTRLIRFTQLSVLNLGWPTETAANQRHGWAVQRPPQGRAAKSPCSIKSRSGDDAAPLCLA